jgi:hypothetical protein
LATKETKLFEEKKKTSIYILADKCSSIIFKIHLCFERL